MRIAAGVLLIIVGIMNGIAGFGYAAVGGAGALAEEAAKQQAAQPGAAEMTDEQKKAVADATKQLAGASGGLATLGIFLLVMLGLQIAGAVTLFMSKAAMFVLIVGVLGIAAELAGPLAFDVGFGVTNILGLVASVLAILASRGYANKSAVA